MAAEEHSPERRLASASACVAVDSRVGENDAHRLTLGSSDSLLPGLIEDVALNCLALVPRSEYPSLSCVNKKYNKLIKDGHVYRLRQAMGIVDVEYLVFILCNLRGWLMFSPMKKTYTELPNMPCDECFNYSDKESLAVDDELLVFGRDLLQFAIWKYGLRSGCWVKCQGMHRPRCLFASGSLRGIGIVAGGADTNGNILASAELYDSSSGRWEMLPSMHSPRKLCSGFFMDGKFYVVGGMSSPNVSVTCGEEFDLETRKWRKIEGMYPNVNGPAQAPPHVVVVNNELFTLEYVTNMVKKYEKVKNKWQVMGRLPPMVDLDSLNGWGLAFKPCEDQLLVFSGKRGCNDEGIVVNSWCPKSGAKDGNLDWKVIGVKENVGVFVYNCAVMACKTRNQS